jgi:glycosyltransferase involved in cell wall biosynthesis
VLARAVDRIEDAVISRADLFVITDVLRLAQHPGAEPRHIVAFPNVPMLSIEAKPWRADDMLVVSYIGSLIPHRSLDLLVDTIGAMADEGVRLVIGGFGVLHDDIRRRAARYPNVEFLGPVPYDEALRRLGESDALVQLGDPSHPGLRWVSPNKLFESMAMGRPLVVTEGSLAAQRATEAGHGVTVRYGDPADLRRVLLCLRKDRTRRISLGAAGRAEFDAAWSPEAVTLEFLQAYRGVLNGGDA